MRNRIAECLQFSIGCLQFRRTAPHSFFQFGIDGLYLYRAGFGQLSRVAFRDLDHSRAQIGDMRLVDHAGQFQVEREEPGAAAQFERGRVGPALGAGDVNEPVTRVVDTAVVEG